MTLATMDPADDWEGTEADLAVLGQDGLTYLVWGGDWCGDCQEQLPGFAAALDAAGVSEEQIEHYPVDEDKQGAGVDEYAIEYIPTVVVERDGEEIVRFVEEEPVTIAEYLAEQLAAADDARPSADD
ncbi:thioredoxin family protein [Haloplanus halobius]|uniref:thioredoxin family protein n=1 Tax=Haloplanus halobius TaxID=2934938 RepID=UPI002010C484|nr:thioredoxin family protein [Haloplanus sp. XH21]